MLRHFQLGRRNSFPWIFIALVAVFFGFANCFQPLQKNIYEILISVVGGAAIFAHFLYAQNHQDTQMFVNLFEKFNARYDKLNEKLNAIISRPIGSPLAAENITTLYDYFNLCAEEYLYYEAGYIDEKVWQAWLRGMSYFAADESVHRLWEKEIESGSYYGFKLCFPGPAGSPKCDCCRPV